MRYFLLKRTSIQKIDRIKYFQKHHFYEITDGNSEGHLNFMILYFRFFDYGALPLLVLLKSDMISNTRKRIELN